MKRSKAEADAPDFVEAADDALMAAQGFTETDWLAEGYRERKQAASAAIGVEFDSYSSGDSPMYLMAAKVITVYRGDCKEIDWQALEAERVEQGWDAKLRAAAQVLGITPKQEEPRWLLVSYWG